MKTTAFPFPLRSLSTRLTFQTFSRSNPHRRCSVVCRSPHEVKYSRKKTVQTKLYNMLILREHASAEFDVKTNWCGECLLFVVGFVNNRFFYFFWRKKISKYVYIYFVSHRKCLVWILQSGCVILPIVVIMMQVVCRGKKGQKKEAEDDGEARPFCTGCSYVWKNHWK